MFGVFFFGSFHRREFQRTHLMSQEAYPWLRCQTFIREEDLPERSLAKLSLWVVGWCSLQPELCKSCLEQQFAIPVNHLWACLKCQPSWESAWACLGVRGEALEQNPCAHKRGVDQQLSSDFVFSVSYFYGEAVCLTFSVPLGDLSKIDISAPTGH